MKLHLPKLLLVAVVAAVSFAQTLHAAEVSNIGNDKYDVGTGTSGSVTTFTNTTVGEDGIVVGTDMQVGAYDESGNLITNFSTYKSDTSAITNNLKIQKTEEYKNIFGQKKKRTVLGDLTIESNGKVAVGGQIDEKTYTGLHADNVLVKDYGQLYATRALFTSLTVQDSANVQLHGGFTNGNGFLGLNMWASSDMGGADKMVQITNSVSIKGGKLSIGTTQADVAQYVFALGYKYEVVGVGYTSNASLSQTKGDMHVYGNTIAAEGLNLTQSGGTMFFRDKLEFATATLGSDTSKITQKEGGELLIGQLAGTVKNSVEISQEGSGSITLAYGANFDSNGTVNVKQSGSGNIHLGGGHTVDIGNDYSEKGYATKYNKTFNGFSTNNATFNLTQTGAGTIHVKDTFAVNSITQNQKGSLTVYADKTLTANTVNAGVITSDKGSVQLNGNVTLTNGTLKTDGSTVTITGKLTADTVNVNSGKLEMKDNGSLNAGKVNAAGVAMNGNNGNVALYDGAISTENNTVTITGTLAADNITVNNGGTLENSVNSVISVGNRLVLESGSKLVNNGVITASSAYALMTADEQAAAVLSETDGPIILKEGSDVLNAGIIDADVVVQGGTLTLGEGGITQNITMESGNILVEGSAVQTGAMTLTGGTITFKNGASVALNDNITYDLSGAEIIVLVEDVNNVKGSTLTLFSGNGNGSVTGLESATFTFQDMADSTNTVGGKITDLGSGSIKVEATVAIPEPTTATLSLLALAGLCARRRRK